MPDIDYVTFHYKNVVSSFPEVAGHFANVDFGQGTDITWYKNIPAPASFFIFNSKFDFMGGYDYLRNCGTVHVADHHISPGKKFFTWGCKEFGQAWQKNLTDSDGPYIEIMTGCYTDNQPDFSWLNPHETKTFEQFWYCLKDMPHTKNANIHGAVSLEIAGDTVDLAFNVTREHHQARVILKNRKQPVFEQSIDITPANPWHDSVQLDTKINPEDLSVELADEEGQPIICYSPCKPYFSEQEAPAAHKPSASPAEIASNEQLYLEGLHLEQYRHPTLDPEPYYEEGLRRDPLDARCNQAMGLRAFRRGDYAMACHYFAQGITRMTARNPNPYDSECYYYLGVALSRSKNKTAEAIQALKKAAWTYPCRAAALDLAAQLQVRDGKWEDALRDAEAGLVCNMENLHLRFIKSAVLRRLGRIQEAEDLSCRTMQLDPLDYGARFEYYLSLRAGRHDDEAGRVLEELRRIMGTKSTSWLELSGDYLEAGLYQEAKQVMAWSPESPMKYYYQGYLAEQTGDKNLALTAYHQAETISMDYCFPARDLDMTILETAVQSDIKGANAAYYLGLLYYARKNVQPAIACWEEATQRNAGLHAAHRCLALAYQDKRQDQISALSEMELAFAQNPDSRYLFELIQLYKVTGRSPEFRLDLLNRYPELVSERDDLYTECIRLHNLANQPDQAAQMLQNHTFHPYEGGEGVLINQHILTWILSGRKMLEQGDPARALAYFLKALDYPEHYHEGRKLYPRESHVQYAIATACQALNDAKAAQAWLGKAAAAKPELDEATFYAGLALRSLGKGFEAQEIFHTMIRLADEGLEAVDQFPYFTGFPMGLPFEQNITRINQAKFHLARLYGYAGLGWQHEVQEERKELARWTDNLVWADIIMETIK